MLTLLRHLAVHAAGAVAAKVEHLKEEKYTDLLHSHEFVPVASCGDSWSFLDYKTCSL